MQRKVEARCSLAGIHYPSNERTRVRNICRDRDKTENVKKNSFSYRISKILSRSRQRQFSFFLPFPQKEGIVIKQLSASIVGRVQERHGHGLCYLHEAYARRRTLDVNQDRRLR